MIFLIIPINYYFYFYIEAISKSPVFTEISQSLCGVSSLRAFGVTDLFISRLESKMVVYTSIAFTKQKINSWLTTRIDTLGAVISFFVVLLAVTSSGFVSPEAMAVGVTYSFSIPPVLGFAMTMGAEVEVTIAYPV